MRWKTIVTFSKEKDTKLRKKSLLSLDHFDFKEKEKRKKNGSTEKHPLRDAALLAEQRLPEVLMPRKGVVIALSFREVRLRDR
jgi:hypothetical protein